MAAIAPGTAGRTVPPMTIPLITTDVPLTDIKPGPTIRSEPPDDAWLELLGEVVENWPPVLLQEGTYRVVDGSARIAVARRLGRATIRARLVPVSDDELYEERVRHNRLHGQPLTAADRRAIARELLARHWNWSNPKLGKAAGLDERTIRRIRKECPSPADAEVGQRHGLDGRSYSVDGAGADLVRELLAKDPGISLGQLEARTGVPRSTAGDIRAELQNVDAEQQPETDVSADTSPTSTAVDGQAGEQAAAVTAADGTSQEAASTEESEPSVDTTAALRPRSTLRRWLGALAKAVRTLLARIGVMGWSGVRRSEPPARSPSHNPTKETT